jgi:hypothetical protein
MATNGHQIQKMQELCSKLCLLCCKLSMRLAILLCCTLVL